jgi:F0F1-type ATP synthase membrane subunit b/b'
MMNEIFWLSVALVIVVVFAYKPVKSAIKDFFDIRIGQVRKLIEDAKKTYQDAKSHLELMEKNLIEQLRINEQKLEQAKNQLISMALESEKEMQAEVEKQLRAFEMQKTISEEMLKKELMSAIISQNVQEIVSGLEENKSKDVDYITKSLDRAVIS